MDAVKIIKEIIINNGSIATYITIIMSNIIQIRHINSSKKTYFYNKDYKTSKTI